MKWFKITSLFLVSLLVILIAVSETPLGQKFLENKVIEALAHFQIHLEAEKFRGQVPNTIDLTHVRIQFNDQTIWVDHLHAKLSLFSLLRKGLVIKTITAEGVEWLDLPKLDLEGSFRIKKSGHTKLNATLYDTDLKAHMTAAGYLKDFSGDVDGLFQDVSFKAHVVRKNDHFEFSKVFVSDERLHVQGDIFFDEETHFTKADLELQTKWMEEPILATGTIEGFWKDRSFDGQIDAVGQFLQERWTLVTPLSIDKTGRLGCNPFHLQSPLFDGTGNLFWQNKRFSGHLLSTLNLALIPNYPINGQLISTIDFSDEIQVQGKIQEMTFDSLYVKEASFQGNSNGNLSINITQARWKQLQLDAAALSAARNEENWIGFLSLRGPSIDAELSGYWRPNQLILEEGYGQYLGTPFQLETPSFINWEQYSWKPFVLRVGENGTLSFSVEHTLDKTDIHANLHQFPLHLLSSAAKGDLNLRLDLHEIDGQSSGQIYSTTSNAEVLNLSNEYIPAEGQLYAQLEQGRLHLKSNLHVQQKPLTTLELDLPLQLQLWPIQAKIDVEDDLSGSFFFNGKTEELLDFFPQRMHRFGGDANCNISLKGPVSSPDLEGSCQITDGFYENYLTGTELTDLTADIKAKGNHLYLTSLTAKDFKKKGNFTATGHLLVSLMHHFPFHAVVDFTRMNIVQIDLVTAEAEGHLTIDGDLNSALAKGHVEIIESQIAIPDKIPRSYPDLQVVYKHGRYTPSPAPPKIPYPLNLDISINAPEGVFIDGRGLQSEWQGQFTVGGTFANPATQGKLELVDGEFSFANRRFKLRDGSLTLKGKAYEMPTINIAATTSEKGIAITALLAGPLNKPQVTFQSSPPLPMSGILSYLLFGQDLSEVSGIQALQLASTVATFAGEGPDILEMTRKSLGIDRLQIVMTPSGNEGEETIALQVGKIIFPGFLVSIKQGADDSSPNIAIEVDLTHGFTFEAQSEQQPAQGKFSLQWNLNY